MVEGLDRIVTMLNSNDEEMQRLGAEVFASFTPNVETYDYLYLLDRVNYRTLGRFFPKWFDLTSTNEERSITKNQLDAELD